MFSSDDSWDKSLVIFENFEWHVITSTNYRDFYKPG